MPQNPASTEFGAAERTRAAAAGDELAAYTRQLAGERGHAFVVVDADPASAIVRAAEREGVDVLVVGNLGMAGRKEFLLGNVPNRISHNARCTVIIVNTLPSGDRAAHPGINFHTRGRVFPNRASAGGPGSAYRHRHGQARFKRAVRPAR